MADGGCGHERAGEQMSDDDKPDWYWFVVLGALVIVCMVAIVSAIWALSLH